MAATPNRPAVWLGIDFGSTTCRGAYAPPDDPGAVVPVPLPLEHFRPCFPISERLPNNQLYCSRFFPGLTQRLRADFELMLEGRRQRARDIVAALVQEAIAKAGTFSGRPIEGLTLCHPIGASVEARQTMREAIQACGLPGGLTNDVEAGCAYFRQHELAKDAHATVLLFSAGYTGLGVAAARIAPRGVRVLASAADHNVLAGNVLDYAILQSALQALQEARILLADHPNSWAVFQHEAETAKHAVRNGEFAVFRVPELLTPQAPAAVRMRLDGPTFRRYVNQHVDKALAVVAAMLEDNGIKEADLSHVLLAGGSTHLDDVVRRIHQRFGAAQVVHLPPEAMANGAALLATDRLDGDADEWLASGAAEPDMPDVADAPRLVTLLEPVVPPKGAALAAPPKAPAADSVAVDTLTLAALRARAQAGDVDGALRDLVRLLEALKREQASLERETVQLAARANGPRPPPGPSRSD